MDSYKQKALNIELRKTLIERISFSMPFKSFLLHLISALMLIGISYILLLQHNTEQFEKQISDDAAWIQNQTTNFILEPLENINLAAIQQRIDLVSQVSSRYQIEIGLFILEKEGVTAELIASTTTQKSSSFFKSVNPQILDVISSNAPMLSFSEEYGSSNQLVSFQPISVYGDPIAALVIKLTPVNFVSIDWVNWIGFAGIIAVCFAVSWIWHQQRVFKPIISMSEWLRSFKANKFSRPTSLATRSDHLGLIARQINTILQSLCNSEDKYLKYKEDMEDLVQERTQEYLLSQEVTYQAIGALAEFRNPEASGHLKRLQAYAKIMAKAFLDQSAHSKEIRYSEIDDLARAAMLHDIGTISLAENILLKPDELTAEEWDTVKQHTTLGGDALYAAQARLGSCQFLKLACEIAYFHHEKWNGQGYPRQLSGEKIPIAARIVAVLDVYDAMISSRSYRQAHTHREAVSFIKSARGKDFDPILVDVFVSIEEEIRQIAISNCDDQLQYDALHNDIPVKEPVIQHD